MHLSKHKYTSMNKFSFYFHYTVLPLIALTVFTSYASGSSLAESPRVPLRDLDVVTSNLGSFYDGSSVYMISGACGEPDWNDPALKSTITGMYSLPGNGGNTGTLVTLLDSDNSTQVQTKNNTLNGTAAFSFVFPQATILTGIELGITDGTEPFRSTTDIVVQASTDGTNYTDISSVFSYGSSLANGAPQYGGTTNRAYTFPFTNSTAYTHYRLYGTNMRTNFSGEFTDIYFDYIEFDAQLSNQDCNDNSTGQDYTDDLVTFDLNPSPGVPGNMYSVAVDGGFTISPSTGTYGQVTSFTISSGSSGYGDLSLTLMDNTTSCSEVVTISNAINSCLPGPCGEPDWNDAALKATLTGDFHIPGTGATDGPLAIVVDSDISSGVGSKTNSFSNTAAFTVAFPQATVLHGMEVVVNETGTEPMTGGTIRVEGSNDGTTYTAVSIDFVHGTNLSVAPAQYGTGAQAYTLPFANNTTAYSYYRIYAVSMSTRFGRRFNELFFDYDFFDPQVSNQGCNDNNTFSDYSDDLVTFDLNPMPGTTGNTYTVDGGSGFTISPTSGTYGQATSFTVSSGSSGAGNLNITLVDNTAPCAQVFEIANEDNACIPGPCGGPDWNLASLKSTIIGDFHIPGTGATAGPLGVLVDSDNSSGVGSKNNNYSNEATFTCEFTESTVLKGMEIVCSGTPITAGVFRVEGSNDGTNYTPVSIDFTFGSNLNLGSSQYGTGNQAYTFPFTDNTTAYSHYRLYAVSMSTAFGSLFNNHRFTELYFNYDVFDEGVDNLSFGDNGTPGVFDDDVVDFSMNPSPGTGTYTVQMMGGYTITPTTGTYGQATNFQVSAGSAGSGDLELLLIDQTVPCVQEVTIPNPDLTATVVASQAACASPTDNPLATITLTAAEGVYTKAEYNSGTVYAGSGYASATDVTNVSTGFQLVNTIPNPTYTTYYTVRTYATETLYRDHVVSVDPKVCSVADLSLSVSPPSESANEGEQLTYVVTLTNAGPDPALNVEVKIDIPAGLELLSSSPTMGDYSPGTQLWTADLVPVGNHELSITYRMK